MEVVNTSAQKVSLAGVQFVQGDIGEGIAFAFNDGSIFSLAPGARAVIAKNRAAFAQRYGVLPVAGEYTGRLDNDGDSVTLKAAAGTVISAIPYDDVCPWPASADGDGYSLTFAGGSQADPANWRTSIAAGGTPGTGDSVPFPGGDILTYALGSNLPSQTWNGPSIIVQQRRAPGTDAAIVTLEQSTDLASWSTPPAGCTEELRTPDGSVTTQWTLPDDTRHFLRVRATQR